MKPQLGGHGADHKRIAALSDSDWHPVASNPEPQIPSKTSVMSAPSVSDDPGDVHADDSAISSVARLEPHSVDPHPAPARRRHRDRDLLHLCERDRRPFCSSPSASGGAMTAERAALLRLRPDRRLGYPVPLPGLSMR